jgi:hypothetical protein
VGDTRMELAEARCDRLGEAGVRQSLGRPQLFEPLALLGRL